MAPRNGIKIERIDAGSVQFDVRDLNPVRFRRQKSGEWAVDIEVLVYVTLADGRTLYFSGVKAIQGFQCGRKPRVKETKPRKPYAMETKPRKSRKAKVAG